MKQFLTTIVCILGLCGMQAAKAAAQERAESSISLEYKMVEDRDLYRLMDFLDVYRLDVKVIGEGLKGREFRVVTVTCKDSVFTETGRERSGIIVSADSDTLDFIFFARQTCPDTVLLSWTRHVPTLYYSHGQEKERYIRTSFRCLSPLIRY